MPKETGCIQNTNTHFIQSISNNRENGTIRPDEETMEKTMQKTNGKIMGNRLVLGILLLLLAGVLFRAEGFAAATATVKGTCINVRKDAGTTYTKVTTLTNGDVTIVNGKKKDANGKIWYQVTFTKDGTEYSGYIIEDYLTVSGEGGQQTATEGTLSEDGAGEAPQTPTVTIRKATVTATGVNVRKKPVSGVVIGKVTKDDIVYVIKGKKGTDKIKWYNITFVYNGAVQRGWIRSDFVRLGEKITSDATGQNENQTTPVPTPSPQPSVDAGTPNRSSIKEMTPDMPGISKNAIRYATVKKNNTDILKKMSGTDVTATLKKGDYVGVIKTKKSPDGADWYYVSFAYFDKVKKGWIRSDNLKLRKKIVREDPDKVQEIDASSSNEDAKPELSAKEFEAYLTQQGFPEDYKSSLRLLHEKYPKWTFRAVLTNLKWDDVMAAETKTGQNLVAKTSIASYKSTATTAYDWKKNTWYTFDGGSWVAASDALVAYYLDPRNFLDESSIFQFESLEYEKYQVAAGVQELLKNTFMNGNFTEPDGTVKSYADTFVEIGQKVGISPYHLAARCYQEQGRGTSDSISGTVKGYENIFNYYNIGAYAAGKNSPSKQGLIYASYTGASAELNYQRPWNTRYKSLLGGAEYVASKYVKVGQKTLYFQKFNVVNTKNGLYRHQYMTNVQAAAAEALKMSKAYVDKNTELVFYIPVYTDMPKTACAKPTGNANPNNYLSSLTVGEYTLQPAFDGAQDQYYLTVDQTVEQVEVSATAVAATSTVLGIGKVALLPGQNDVCVQCVSESGNEKSYYIHITR